MLDGYHQDQIVSDFYIAVTQAGAVITELWTRPSILRCPRLFKDGDKWCALYGSNLQEGIAGFGDSPDAAMKAFDAAWFEGQG